MCTKLPGTEMSIGRTSQLYNDHTELLKYAISAQSKDPKITTEMGSAIFRCTKYPGGKIPPAVLQVQAPTAEMQDC
ncbi:hypothetical protein DSO57_1004548 [Entomophthora muscae]|uniref:Uncharacterized protein n=1 Tax=Entomophthora muscae TaxID=34485 RepID=A0ACC2SA26_9FUNG|nr:hypothetical protein DSO57_1004548 [Entomophthora muscae]